MAIVERIALASSGSLDGVSAEDAAIKYCQDHGFPELTIIHILETQLSRYGEFDQLAPGTCKADFIDYIQKTAKENLQRLKDRLEAKATKSEVYLKWIIDEGDPVTGICKVVVDSGVTQLFISDSGERTRSLLPRKKHAIHIQNRTSIDVTVIPR